MNKVEWTLPGTVLSVDADRPQAAEEVFSSLFLAGGLVLSQVTQVTGWSRTSFKTGCGAAFWHRRSSASTRAAS